MNNSRTIPNFDDEMVRLTPLLKILGAELERATEAAATFFENEHRPYNAWSYPFLVRQYLLWFLQDRGFSPEQNEFNLRTLSNIGIAITYRQRLIRIWKSVNGDLPPAGDSEPKLAFFNQQQLSLFDQVKPQKQVVELHLALLWEADVDRRLNQMRLAAPRWADATVTMTYFNRAIPWPLETDTGIGSLDEEPTAEDVDIQLVEDDEDTAEDLGDAAGSN